MKGAFEQLKGRTVRSVIISQYNAGCPQHQLFLIFDDDTSFEVSAGNSRAPTQWMRMVNKES